MEHDCKYEARWGKMETLLELFVKKVTAHVDEGDRHGGYRDRLILIEEAVKNAALERGVIKRGYWIVGLGSGLIGALVGKLNINLVEIIMEALKHMR